ncbi:AAA family ATPase [Streptomyces sp. NPDC059894]|uniref:AAA family ATPase n=1 Tax=unclassified Streptomyces TaxID=2593676 RepID=UPI00364ED17A
MHAPHDEALAAPGTMHGGAQAERFRDTALVGRGPELLTLDRFLDRAEGDEDVLVLSGEIGVGKSALVRAAVEAAYRDGLTVVDVRGHETEADVRGAGVAQVLLRLAALPGLPPASADDDGFTTRIVSVMEGPRAAGLTLSDALQAASTPGNPLLLTVDDAHWWDPESLEALRFAVERAPRGTVGLLLATRSDDERGLTGRFPSMVLGPLDATASARLLDACERYLSPPLAKRLLAEAAGFPAAIVGIVGELRRTGIPAASLLAPRLPLGEPLQRRLAALLDGVPARAREFLLVAAEADSDRLDLLVTAAEGAGMDVDGLTAARSARLVDVRGPRLRFRHPLLRSAVHWASSFDERRRVNLALAELATDDPYRRALHIASVSTVPDEDTAAALEKGVGPDLPEAAAVLELAAGLSPSAHARATRLIKAAEAAGVRGHVRGLRRLVGQLTAAPVNPSLTAAAAALEARVAYNNDGIPAHAVSLLLRSADADSTQWPHPFVPVACGLAPALCEPEWGDALRPALEEMLGHPDRQDDPHLMSALTWTDRETYGRRARAVLDRGVAESGTWSSPADLAGAVALVTLSTALDDPVTTDLVGSRVLRPLVDLGHFGTATTVLIHLQIAHVHLGVGAAVEHDSALGHYWARSSEDMRARMAFQSGVAQARAWKGDEDGHGALTDEVLAYGLPRRLQMLTARTRWSRGLMSLSNSRPEEAFEELFMLSSRDGDAWHPIVAGWALGDLVAAAVASGREDEVRTHVARAARVSERTRSTLLDHLVARCRALLSEDDEAERYFEAALDVRSAPLRYERARTRLAFGEWLRRRRRVLEARTHLQSAHDAFTALGADSWTRRAASELLAAGEAPASAHPAWAERFQLTPREAEVARLAASGLTNQRIGWQLGLTHRTVASHLSRVFLKVGVDSRRQLPAALHP